MQALKELFTSFPGLLSLGVIVFTVVIVGFIIQKMMRNVEENK